MTINRAKVHFIVGKGGVGRTTIAEALAAKFSLTEKTLLVSFKKEDSLKRHRVPVIEKISPQLFRLDFSPEEAMREYLELKIASVKVIEKLFGNSLFHALSGAAPGLSDFARMGKIWFHADPINRDKGAVQFDKIVVDMPSAGFVPRFLSIGATVKDAVKIGPLAHEALLINEYMGDSNNALVHVATLLEEIVVSETLELLDALKNESNVKTGMVFANFVRLIDIAKAEKLLKELPGDAVYITTLLRDSLARTKEEQALLDELKKHPSRIVLIPEFIVSTNEELKQDVMDALP